MAAPPSFPRQHARTRGFTLGEPRGFSVAADGSRVAFLRSLAADDPVNRLWALDLGQGERMVADPVALLGGADEQLPTAERARRERVRERAGGIVAYAADRHLTLAAFALGGRLFAAGLGQGGSVREVAAAGPVLDPRPDPAGRRVAYVTGGGLHVVELAPAGVRPRDRRLAAEPGQSRAPEVTWGLAEFIAAEEMGRDRGYWWAPDGRRLAVARVDARAVQRFHLADPSSPAVEPVTLRYPAAGTANADVRLFVVDLEGARVEVTWDRSAFPYLVEVVWQQEGPLTLLVQSRDQTGTCLLAADPETGSASALAAAHHPAWLEIVPGVPAWLAGGRLVATVDDLTCDTRRLAVDGEPVTPPGLQVLEVLAARGDEVLLRGSEEPTEVHVWRVRVATPASTATVTRLSEGPGVHNATAGGDALVLASAGLDRDGSAVTVRRDGRRVATVRSLAETPALRPHVTLLRAGGRALRSALLLPSSPPGEPLPVLLDPYGGPHARRVLAARGGFLIPQWFAEQGFAVLVSDGRGTPGRGPAWERAVHRDLAGPPLEDQVEALHAVAGCHPELDLGRVAIRGWSFGGYLAALAVLRRPDVFHAAVAGAPVTDWRLYDTHYTERYLGHPGTDPEPYRRSSLLADAARLERPLLLIHGLADDNVVAAHTLRLSSLLLAAGRVHSVLPLSGVTHMTPQEVVAENLLLLQLAFLRAALGLPPACGA
ncbi:MAG TPA: prolyl oligopeptidase family serine peptidase [Actinomycetes bacterium]|nr:prolyl oligopeptidase family serine peptidase [Actinomycetes bacterium]